MPDDYQLIVVLKKKKKDKEILNRVSGFWILVKEPKERLLN